MRGVEQKFEPRGAPARHPASSVAQAKVAAPHAARGTSPPTCKPQLNPRAAPTNSTAPKAVPPTTAGTAQLKKPPTAPPVYRPQPPPRVLQPKAVSGGQLPGPLKQAKAAATPARARGITPPPTPRQPARPVANKPAATPPATPRENIFRAAQPKMNVPLRPSPPPPPARAGFAPHAAAIQLMRDEKKRKAKKKSPYGNESLEKLTVRQKVLKKQKSEEYVEPDEKELEVKKKFPPPKIFLKWGGRQELGWAKTSKTKGQTGDKYKYDNAKKDETQQTPLRTEYLCCICDNFFPLKSKMTFSDDSFITLDHIPAMSQRLDGSSLVITYCDGTDVWQGTGREIALESYNDPDLLRFMCQSCNSRRGGKKDYFAEEPVIIDVHTKNCTYPHKAEEIKKYG